MLFLDIECFKIREFTWLKGISSWIWEVTTRRGPKTTNCDIPMCAFQIAIDLP